ncbi:MAG: AGE family epimerase/isomerase [Saprospiraceae bacterium]|nr:AGE family epimerase/isomerase [Saprospiraceae bacterium]
MYRLLILLILFACKSGTQTGSENQTDAHSLNRDSLADAMEMWMLKACVDPWYPQIIDSTYGGYLSDFNYKWELDGRQNKMIVTQARHIWTASVLAEQYPDNTLYPQVAEHGFQFLRDKMWDAENGGFYQLVNRQGDPLGEDSQNGIIKTAYGNSFGMYGLAAYYRISKKEEVLDLAKKTFQWLEEHSHDPETGGYFQFLGEDGTPMKEGHTNPAKDQNSSIHLLEALTELYMVWPDDLLKERVREMLHLVRDTITNEKASLTLFLDKDWNPATNRDSSEEYIRQHIHEDHVSFGHDIETAYLLMEASHVIHAEDDAMTRMKAKKMVDHTIEYGWDDDNGGIYDGGYYFRDKPGMSIVLHEKAWWAQVEAMNTLLIMTDLYPDDPIDYEQYFLEMWEYTRDNLIDKEYPGIFVKGLDQSPDARKANKAGIWKGNYHNVRSFLNCIKRLRGLSE